MRTAAAGRPQLRGSRMAASSQSASSSKATAVSSVSRVSRRSDSDADGSTGASAVRSSCSMSKFASAILFVQALFELFDRSMYQHLRRTFGAAASARDLAVVHVEREAHDQCRLPVFGEIRHAGEHLAKLLPALDEVVRAPAVGEWAGVVEVGLGTSGPVAEVVRSKV